MADEMKIYSLNSYLSQHANDLSDLEILLIQLLINDCVCFPFINISCSMNTQRYISVSKV